MQFDDLILTYSKYRMYCRKVKSFFSLIYKLLKSVTSRNHIILKKEKRRERINKLLSKCDIIVT